MFPFNKQIFPNYSFQTTAVVTDKNLESREGAVNRIKKIVEKNAICTEISQR